MLLISIKGLVDGSYPIEETVECSAIEGCFEEFFGVVHVSGTLRKHGKRYIIQVKASAKARLICDISGEEYEEDIVADFSLEYVADTTIANLRHGTLDAEQPYYIREDNLQINISDELRQELAVHLPLKRVAPHHKGKDFSEIYPDYSAEAVASLTDKPIDPRWAALQFISFEKEEKKR
jgi:uncharacterized metal-binding protein YceD (DUF177 family)